VTGPSRVGVAWWAIVSATLAPIALIGGWTLAESRQPAGYDAARQTISDLASRGATDRWLMTSALLVLGVCHIVTALGLHAAGRDGRWLLAAGGLGLLLVAAAPQPAHGSNKVHVDVAAFVFLVMSVWPVASGRPGPYRVLTPRVCAYATAVLLVLLVWFGLGSKVHSLVGVSERVLVAAQAIWPLVVVIGVRRHRAALSPPLARGRVSP
jgi:hypothetical membrane protein